MTDTNDMLIDRVQLLELLARYTDMCDLKNWDDLPLTVFADEVEWDFSSLGAPAVRYARDELVSRLRAAFPGWKATLHATTGHQVTIDGDHATIHAKIRTEHWLPAEVAGYGRAAERSVLDHFARAQH